MSSHSSSSSEYIDQVHELHSAMSNHTASDITIERYNRYNRQLILIDSWSHSSEMLFS